MRQSGGPARYKRKRNDPRLSPPAAGPLGETGGDELFEDDTPYADAHYDLDPLDAQNAGLHDHELTLGHEEIHLNLDDDSDGAPIEHPATLKHE